MDMQILRILIVLSLSLPFVLTQGQVKAAGAKWGPDDLRRVMTNWLRANDKDVPEAEAIGPIDSRLALEPCENPIIAPRGASATTFTVKCEGPSRWDYILRTDYLSSNPTQVALRPDTTIASNKKENSWKVVVPRVDLPIGTFLTENVLEERIVTSQPSAQAIKSIQDAIGFRLIGAASPGIALTTRLVSRPPTVVKGEPITLIAKGNGFDIAVKGRAEQDGFEGELISVTNMGTGAVLKGRLEAGKIVTIQQM